MFESVEVESPSRVTIIVPVVVPVAIGIISIT
jgi:hypothetical protein